MGPTIWVYSITANKWQEKDAFAGGYRHNGIRCLCISCNEAVAWKKGSNWEAVAELFNSNALTPREEEIYQLYLRGFKPKEIGKMLGILAHTVGEHRSAIFRKKGVNSVNQLLAQRINELEKENAKLQSL